MFRLLLGSGQESGVWQSVVIIAFFLIFIGIIVLAISAKKRYIKYMSELPLEDQKI